MDIPKTHIFYSLWQIYPLYDLDCEHMLDYLVLASVCNPEHVHREPRMEFYSEAQPREFDKLGNLQQDTLSPKLNRQACLKPQSPSYIQDLSVFTLNPTILLWRMNT